ncbi:MAG TPA: hypothetical protein VGB07_36360 [Blastocatellia bacterium]
MSEVQIPLSEFVRVVREVASSSNTSAEFRYFVERLYQRIMEASERGITLGERSWVRRSIDRIFPNRYEAEISKRSIPLVVLGERGAGKASFLHRAFEIQNSWQNESGRQSEENYLVYVDGVGVYNLISGPQKFNLLSSEQAISRRLRIFTGEPHAAAGYALAVGELKHSPVAFGLPPLEDDFSKEDTVASELINEQLSQALSQIDESRKEIEASSARTRALREETNAILASIGG